MRKILYSFLLFGFAVVLLVGCATIVSKYKYPVDITSQPEGADITVVNSSGKTVFTGKTPATATLKAGAGL